MEGKASNCRTFSHTDRSNVPNSSEYSKRGRIADAHFFIYDSTRSYGTKLLNDYHLNWLPFILHLSLAFE